MNQGTIGEKQPAEIIDGLTDIVNEGRNPKQTVFNYLSKFVTQHNYEGLTNDLS